MITLYTYLSWPKTMTFEGWTAENLVALEKYLKGPDYAYAITLDICLICMIALIAILVYTVINWKKL